MRILFSPKKTVWNSHRWCCRYYFESRRGCTAQCHATKKSCTTIEARMVVEWCRRLMDSNGTQVHYRIWANMSFPGNFWLKTRNGKIYKIMFNCNIFIWKCIFFQALIQFDAYAFYALMRNAWNDPNRNRIQNDRRSIARDFFNKKQIFKKQYQRFSQRKSYTQFNS